MGEAKRRKQKLGSAYGTKQPPLNPRLQERHLNKFAEEASSFIGLLFEEHFENYETIQAYLDETQGELVEKVQTWLENYLSAYEPQDQIFLANTYIKTLLYLFDQATDTKKTELAFSIPVACLAYQPYLGEEVAEAVTDFLADVAEFHEMLIEEEKMLDEEE